MKLLIFAAALASLLLAACTSAGGTNEPSAEPAATVQPTAAEADRPDDGPVPVATDTNDEAPADSPAGLEPEDALLAFAQCMRDEGIDYPDPQPDQLGNIYIPTDDPAYGLALDTCSDILADATHDQTDDPARLAETQDLALAIAQCVRDKGFDFPDPVVTPEGDVSLGGAIDLSEPGLREASQECVRSLLGDIGGAR